jgi:hypothetical protein
MAKLGSSASGTKTAARSVQKATGGSAGIEIVGFPQKLYKTFGDTDTLFVPLLTAARDANKMMARPYRPGGRARKCSHVERDAVGVFVAIPRYCWLPEFLYPYS